jgi:hypothetical protein
VGAKSRGGALRVAALRALVGARAAERALVEEEELHVAPPAEGPVDAVALGVGRRHVLEEGAGAVGIELAAVDLLDALLLGGLGHSLKGRVVGLVLGEVVEELVVVPVVVDAALRPHAAEAGVGEHVAVLAALGRQGQCDRVLALVLGVGVRVHRVAHVHVEVVALGGHAGVDREGSEEQLAHPRDLHRIGVAAVGEANGRIGARRRRGLKPADLTAVPAHREAVVVGLAGLEADELEGRGQVGGARELDLLGKDGSAEAAVGGDLHDSAALLVAAGPQQR